MKEATGEVSMTVITLVAVAVIGAVLAIMWPQISEKITDLWNEDPNAGACVDNNGDGICD